MFISVLCLITLHLKPVCFIFTLHGELTINVHAKCLCSWAKITKRRPYLKIFEEFNFPLPLDGNTFLSPHHHNSSCYARDNKRRKKFVIQYCFHRTIKKIVLLKCYYLYGFTCLDMTHVRTEMRLFWEMVGENHF